MPLKNAMKTKARILAAAAVTFLVVSPHSLSTAAAQPAEDGGKGNTKTCLEAYRSAQELRLEGKLGAAREKASFCAQEQCPDAVRSGCTKWLSEIIDTQPSIAISARGVDGNDVSDVEVFLDGQLVAKSLGGRPIDVDPGRHLLKFVHRGQPPIEKEIIVAEGVKNRTVSVDFAPPSTPGGNRAGGADRPAPAAPSIVGPVVVGAVGVASLGVFAVLGSMGSSEVDEMHETCGVTHTCPDDRIDSARTKLVVGDVFLVTGIVGVTAAVVWYVGGRATTRESAAARLSVTPRRDGAATSFRVGF